MKKITKYSIVLLSFVGIWQLSSGTYIYAKAILAQYLLENAWEKTLAGNEKVKPWSWADTWPVARLYFKKYDVDHIVLEGSTGSSLAFAPGHMEGTALPGETGVSVIGGHRDTHFAFLQYVAINDEFSVENIDGQSSHYKITNIEIVDSRNSAIYNHFENHQIVLVTCYPFDALQAGGPLRYVVTAEQI